MALGRRLGGEVWLGSVRPLHAQEAVGGVADAAWQHPLPQHGVDHRTLPVAGSEEGQHKGNRGGATSPVASWFKRKIAIYF